MEHNSNNNNNPHHHIDIAALLSAHAKILAQLTQSTIPTPLTAAPPPSYAATMGDRATPNQSPAHQAHPLDNASAPTDAFPDDMSETSDFAPSDCTSDYFPHDADNTNHNDTNTTTNAPTTEPPPPPNTLTITAPTLISGSNNIVAVAPIDALRIAAMLAAVLDRPGCQNSQPQSQSQQHNTAPSSTETGTGPATATNSTTAPPLPLLHPLPIPLPGAPTRPQTLHRPLCQGSGNRKWHINLDLSVRVVGSNNVVGAAAGLGPLGPLRVKRKAGGVGAGAGVGVACGVGGAGAGERGRGQQGGGFGVGVDGGVGVGVGEGGFGVDGFEEPVGKRRRGFGMGMGDGEVGVDMAAGGGGEDAGVGAGEVGL
ncbi:hypothetical protein K490DRAFT_67991 [Saccharata proteae CBS 121410]|uniref:Uncharacterized protein n=1 Tax=Saccharata proteae CBS 121410 TaxID=1314787 RepID=A0A9P4HNS5_9PEZI|nr:hypothetical protein K490DRAFT_67991 [Saccharata proteae CBS 121410]